MTSTESVAHSEAPVRALYTTLTLTVLPTSITPRGGTTEKHESSVAAGDPAGTPAAGVGVKLRVARAGDR